MAGPLPSSGRWALLPWDAHPAPMSLLNLMAHLMKLSLAGIVGCQCQFLGTQFQGLPGPGGLTSGVSGLECGAGQVHLQLHSSSRALGPDTAALPGTQSPSLLLALVPQELLYVLGRGWGPSG